MHSLRTGYLRLKNSTLDSGKPCRFSASRDLPQNEPTYLSYWNRRFGQGSKLWCLSFSPLLLAIFRALRLEKKKREGIKRKRGKKNSREKGKQILDQIKTCSAKRHSLRSKSFKPDFGRHASSHMLAVSRTATELTDRLHVGCSVSGTPKVWLSLNNGLSQIFCSD